MDLKKMLKLLIRLCLNNGMYSWKGKGLSVDIKRLEICAIAITQVTVICSMPNVVYYVYSYDNYYANVFRKLNEKKS